VFSIELVLLGGANHTTQTLTFTQTDVAGNLSATTDISVNYSQQNVAGGGLGERNPSA